MSVLRGILIRRDVLVAAIVLILIASVPGCRRGANKNTNSNASNSLATSDPEEAKKQAQALVEKGKDLYKNDQDEQALEAFAQAVQLNPELAEAHLRLGMANAALDKKDEAEQSYKKAIELFKKQVQADPKDARGFFYLGEAHSFLHQDEEAARAYRQATRLAPEDQESFFQLGKAETKLAHYPEATAAFQKALDLDPNDSRASEGLENAQQGAQRIREGRKHAEDMLKKQENANANSNASSSPSSKPKPTRPPGKPW